LSAPPDPLAAIRGGFLLLRGKEGREGEGRRNERKRGDRRKRMGGKGKGGLPPLYLISGYGPGSK